MKTSLLLLSPFVVLSNLAWGDPSTAQVADLQKAIQDPKTKVIYYLESDLRHIAALGPDGKLLWCSEVIPASAKPRVHILSWGFDAKDDRLIDVVSNPAGPEYGIIHKRTGHYISQGAD